MSGVISNNINSAILSSQFGLQRSFEGMTQASLNIAQRAAQQRGEQDGPQALLADAAVNNLRAVRDTLPTGSSNFATDLLSLKLNSINAQASAKVLDVANETVGTIIDTLA